MKIEGTRAMTDSLARRQGLRVHRVLRGLQAGAAAASRELSRPAEQEPQATPAALRGRPFGEGAVGFVTRAFLVVALVALVLTLLGLFAALPDAWVAYGRVVCAAVLVPAGTILVIRARRIRPLLREQRPQSHPVRRAMHGWRTRLFEQIADYAGRVMILVGAFEVVLALVHFL